MHYLSLTLPVFFQRNHDVFFHILTINGSLKIQLTSYHFRFYFVLKKKSTAKNNIYHNKLFIIIALFPGREIRASHRHRHRHRHRIYVTDISSLS